ncbi:hypothetical protein BWO91_14320 [Plantibacter flavus]|nr:hypothetical protein BWO91_14320 [Plantibacter flavus]
MNGSRVFDAAEIEGELRDARTAALEMVRGARGALSGAVDLTMGYLSFLGFVERAQAFHLGTVDMVEAGNPLAAATLLRSFAENLAVVFYIEKHPGEMSKLYPGAEQGLAMGKVIAAAQKSLPGFKRLHDHLSSMAHPSGSGAFQTLRTEPDGRIFWQSHPTFLSNEDALQYLKWLAELRGLTATVIRNTAAGFAAAESSAHQSG